MGVFDIGSSARTSGGRGNTALKAAVILGAIELIRRNGGLRGISEKMKSGGLGNIFNSWVSRGSNQPVPPGNLETALGPSILEQLAAKLGIPRQQAAQHLAETLPEVVDRATPDGEIPESNDVPDDVLRELSDLSRAHV
jgi:uncharacterized protein YidB (DUF937 family)